MIPEDPHWTDFAIFLSADDRSGPLFLILNGRCHGNQFCEKMANSPHSSIWISEMEWEITTSMCAVIFLYRVKT